MTTLHPIDQELLARIARRDEAALATLYDRYAGLLYSLALRICGEPQAAEEVLQDVFLTVWRSADRWDPARGSVQAWLVTITRHRAIDHLRKKNAEPPLPLHNGATRDEATPDEIAENRELARDLRRAIDQLPADFRDVLELVYFSGMTQREAAEALAIPYGTVKSRIRLALERIARFLNGQGVDA